MGLGGGFGVQILVALAAEIEMFALFEGVVEGDPLCELGLAALAFASPHPGFKHFQGILILFDGVGGLIFGEYPKVFEDDDVVTAVEMAVEVGPPEDYSKVFDFGFVHFEEHGYFFQLGVEVCLGGEGDDFFYFFFGDGSLVVEAFFYQAERVNVLILVPSFQLPDQAVEGADYFQQGLLAIADVLQDFLAVDAIVEIQVQQRLSQLQMI